MVNYHEKYLGLPTMVANEVLLKAVIQSILFTL